MGLLDRRLLFVTGKGGVGKTTVAAALARLAARDHGKRVLVCEMDAKGSLAEVFDVAPLGFNPRELSPGLHAMAMNTEDSLREYLRLFVKLPFVGRIGPLARMFDFVADAAPGVKEILAIGKLCYEVRERHYDLVVVDAEASGHIVAQITAPRAINSLVQVGLVREQTAWMNAILDDAATTGLVVTATPEEMPVTESIELLERLRQESHIDVAAIVANRTLPEPFGAREHELFERITASPGPVCDRAGDGAATVLEAAALAIALRRAGSTHIARLRAAAPSHIPMLFVPELYTRSHSSRTVELVATALADEL